MFSLLYSLIRLEIAKGKKWYNDSYGAKENIHQREGALKNKKT